MLLNHHSFHKQVKIFLFFTFRERHIFCPYAFACQYRMKLAKQMSNILAIVDMIQIVGSEVTLPLMASASIVEQLSPKQHVKQCTDDPNVNSESREVGIRIPTHVRAR